MRRRTISLLFFGCTLLGVRFLWPSRRQEYTKIKYIPPRLRKAEPEVHNWVVPPKLANGTVPIGWRAFPPPDSYLTAPFAIEPSLAQTLPCVDEWVSEGKVCESKHQARMDVLWTWINGSEPVLGDTRDKLAAAHMRGPRPPSPLGFRTSHFRTHGELLNSMRSVLEALPSELVRQYILLTADVAADDTEELRLGAVPTWLDVDQGPRLRVFHHSDIFRIPKSSLRSKSKAEQQGREWRDRIVPSFNSHAIESQLPNIHDLAPTLLYMNDDFFLLKPLSAADFQTPLYGPVFRIQLDLDVRSTPPDSVRMGVDREGEWPGLEYANWLIDQRFGKRQRRYLHHVAKVLPTPIMRETAAVWAEEMAKTAETQFRGRGPQLNIVYLTTWYTIEKHREALLYSFIMLRVDANADGVFSPAERRNLIDGLASGEVTVQLREGGSAHVIARNFERAGLAPPKETEYSWLSSDGYPLIRTFRRESSVYCTIDIDNCFPRGSPLEVFKRVAFKLPECGDCLIAHLINKSGPEGLSAFLPPPTTPNPPPPELLAFSKRWQDAKFPAGLGREFAVDYIQRYTYVVGTSAMQFLALKRQRDTKRLPNNDSSVAFLAVNDDIQNPLGVSQTDADMRAWYAQRWGAVRGWWEKQ
ncbi:hypothetical protein DFH07DRAFT_347232 [Mycena maculata]|uniref:Stealth protein CR3 conserved region 3 domain-containing protein n=1 Tax=Mycena maculata TaxID=230809 RepID=A0AAD7MH02_9AGAR|nr:hypothetical protein DFH07DRAFT_347232 [Mycena maculata]